MGARYLLRSRVCEGLRVDLRDRLFLETLAKHGPRMTREELFQAYPYEQVQRAEVDEWLENALADGLVTREEGAGGVALSSITPVGEAQLT